MCSCLQILSERKGKNNKKKSEYLAGGKNTGTTNFPPLFTLKKIHFLKFIIYLFIFAFFLGQHMKVFLGGLKHMEVPDSLQILIYIF